MTTQHTHHLTVIAEAGKGPINSIDAHAKGDHLLWDPDDPPTHRDADGTEYRVAEAPWTPEIAEALRGIENAPQIQVIETGEVVPLDEVDGRETMWVDEGSDVAMVRTVPRSEALDGLERIETEGDL